MSLDGKLDDSVLAELRRKFYPVEDQQQIPVPVHADLPDALDGFGRLDVADGLVVRIVDVAICGGVYDGGPTQGAVHELVGGFEQWCVMLEVTKGSVGAVHDEL